MGAYRWEIRKQYNHTLCRLCVASTQTHGDKSQTDWEGAWWVRGVHICNSCCNLWAAELVVKFVSYATTQYGEGNGTPLQCSCLENPGDGEASVLTWRIPGTGEPGGRRLRGCPESDTTEVTQQQQQQQQQYLIVLIYNSQMTYDVEYLFICLVATWCDFNDQFVQIFAHFSVEFLVFLLRVLCIFWEMVLYQIRLANIICL